MVYNNAKRIVVIKDIPSNIIEEAIFILKSEPEIKGENKKSRESAAVYSSGNKDYLLKEAESIINSYITDNKLNDRNGSGVSLKLNYHKRKFKTNLAINLSMIGSIALLIFVLSRFF